MISLDLNVMKMEGFVPVKGVLLRLSRSRFCQNEWECTAKKWLYLQLANSSRAIDWGAIFSAVSWAKLLLITVLGSCNILECDSKVFFFPTLLCFVVFCCSNSMGIVDCICSNWQKMDFPALQFIISVTLHVCPLICATKEKQTMMAKVLYQIRKSNINLFL